MVDVEKEIVIDVMMTGIGNDRSCRNCNNLDLLTISSNDMNGCNNDLLTISTRRNSNCNSNCDSNCNCGCDNDDCDNNNNNCNNNVITASANIVPNSNGRSGCFSGCFRRNR